MPKNMNNLPASISVDGRTWSRTTSQSTTGTYSYVPCASQSEADSKVSTLDHFTVCGASATNPRIQNIHLKHELGDGQGYYFYPSNQFKFRDAATQRGQGNSQELKRLLTDCAIALGYSLTADRDRETHPEGGIDVDDDGRQGHRFSCLASKAIGCVPASRVLSRSIVPGRRSSGRATLRVVRFARSLMIGRRPTASTARVALIAPVASPPFSLTDEFRLLGKLDRFGTNKRREGSGACFDRSLR